MSRIHERLMPAIRTNFRIASERRQDTEPQVDRSGDLFAATEGEDRERRAMWQQGCQPRLLTGRNHGSMLIVPSRQKLFLRTLLSSTKKLLRDFAPSICGTKAKASAVKPPHHGQLRKQRERQVDRTSQGTLQLPHSLELGSLHHMDCGSCTTCVGTGYLRSRTLLCRLMPRGRQCTDLPYFTRLHST